MGEPFLLGGNRGGQTLERGGGGGGAEGGGAFLGQKGNRKWVMVLNVWEPLKVIF